MIGFHCFPSSLFLLFSLLLLLISLVFLPPPPPPPHFYCFSLLLLISIVFHSSSASSSSSSSSFLLFFPPPPPPPPPPHFYCFPSSFSSSSSPSFYCFLSFAHSFHFFFPRVSIKDCQLPSLVRFEEMFRVVNNNRGFLQLLADCPAYQLRFLLKTATPQQLHALVQVLYNVLMGHIPIPEENKRILLPYKDALLDLASPNVPYKTKKRVLVQEGSGFIEGVLAPVVSSLGFLMLYKS